MSKTTYTYSISKDTARGGVDRARLTAEILKLQLNEYLMGVRTQESSLDGLDLHFTGDLDAVSLDQVVYTVTHHDHSPDLPVTTDKFVEEEYNKNSHIIRRTYFAGNWADSSKIKEETYVYEGVRMVSSAIRYYDDQGAHVSEFKVAYSYETTKVGKNTIVRRVRA